MGREGPLFQQYSPEWLCPHTPWPSHHTLFSLRTTEKSKCPKREGLFKAMFLKDKEWFVENNRKGLRRLEIPVCLRVHISAIQRPYLLQSPGCKFPGCPTAEQSRGWEVLAPVMRSVSAVRPELQFPALPSLTPHLQPEMIRSSLVCSCAPPAPVKPGSRDLHFLP